MAVSNELVVSLYGEDYGWIPAALETCKVDRVVVYNKGPRDVRIDDARVSVVAAPNVGREGETFLRHIIQNWGRLPRGVWFAQGDPFEHSPDFVGLLGKWESYADEPYWSMSDRFKESLSMPPKHMVDSSDAYRVDGLRCSNYFVRDMQLVGHCSFLDQGVRVILKEFRDRYRVTDSFEYLSARLRIARPRPITDFSFGACFYTLGSCIRRHPRWVYEEARRFLLETDDQGGFQGFVLERYWPYLVCGRSYECLSDCYRGLIGGPPLGVWNRSGKRFWLKEQSWEDVVYSPDSVVCFFDGGRVRHLAGVDVVGRDAWSRECVDLGQADGLLLGSSGLGGPNS